jgi:hypothetical protein
MAKIYEYHFSVKPHISRIYEMDGGLWFHGFVMTEYGTVGIYVQGSEKYTPHTKLEFACGKTVYVRSFNERYSKRRIVTLAKRFAKEISEAND